MAANVLLAVLWASQANTVPATFWSLAFLLLPENAHHRLSITQQLLNQQDSASGDGATVQAQQQQHNTAPGRDPVPTASGGLLAAAFLLATDRKSCASRCVAESIRLRVQSIDVRVAAADLTLRTSTGQSLQVPKGRILAICPFESHHDSQLYPGMGPEILNGDGNCQPVQGSCEGSEQRQTGQQGFSTWDFNPYREPMSVGDPGAIAPSVAGERLC